MTFLRKLFGTNGSGNENSKGKICIVCGRVNTQGVKYCSSCGSEFPVLYDDYDGFISYRRETGSDLASLIKIQLENRFHKRIFLDVKELQVGRFDEALLHRIEETPNFILILSKASLDRCENKSDWLKREIMHALETGRNIIPLLVDGFAFPLDDKWALLPPDMKVLSSLNGIAYSHIHQDSAIRKIASYMKAEMPRIPIQKVPVVTESDDESHIDSAVTVIRNTSVKTNIPTDDSETSEVMQPENQPTTVILSTISEPPVQPVNTSTSPQSITHELLTQCKDEQDTSSSENLIFAENAITFAVGAKDSEIRSFCYIAGSALKYSLCGLDGNRVWYQMPGIVDKTFWLDTMSQVEQIDKRVFFKIVETEQVGYLVDIWEDWRWFHSSIKRINIDDNNVGEIEVKMDQISSIIAKQNEISVRTKGSDVFTGNLRKVKNYECSSLTMGSCLVTNDAIIALVRTNRASALTLNRIDLEDNAFLVHDRIYWDRSQLKFRLQASSSTGYFDERIRDLYIQFSEQSLGWMRISIPQIKRLTVDLEYKEAPVRIETFSGNVYQGVCSELFSLSGTLISFDKVKKNLILNSLEQEVPIIDKDISRTMNNEPSKLTGITPDDAGKEISTRQSQPDIKAGKVEKLDDKSPEIFGIEVTLRNGEILKDVQMRCGPRGWSSYVESIQFTTDLDVIRSAKFGPSSGRMLSFDKIALIRFLEFNEEEKEVIAENYSYRYWIRKANLDFNDGTRLENIYILDICYLTTPYEKIELSKIEVDMIRFGKKPSQ